MDDARLEEVWRSEHASLVRAIYLTCGDVALASEIVDQAFYSVFARSKRTPIQNLRSYLWRAAFNESQRRRRREGRVAMALQRVGRRPDSHSSADTFDPQEDLMASLGRLSDQARVVVVLRYFGDLSLQQIADHQRLPLGTVKSLLHRSLAAMREDLLAHPGSGIQ